MPVLGKVDPADQLPAAGVTRPAAEVPVPVAVPIVVAGHGMVAEEGVLLRIVADRGVVGRRQGEVGGWQPGERRAETGGVSIGASPLCGEGGNRRQGEEDQEATDDRWSEHAADAARGASERKPARLRLGGLRRPVPYFQLTASATWARSAHSGQVLGAPGASSATRTSSSARCRPQRVTSSPW